MSKDMRRAKRDVTSAMYFLVWHGGMSYGEAETVLISCRAVIRPLATAGRVEGRKCFAALSAWIDRVSVSRVQYPAEGG